MFVVCLFRSILSSTHLNCNGYQLVGGVKVFMTKWTERKRKDRNIKVVTGIVCNGLYPSLQGTLSSVQSCFGDVCQNDERSVKLSSRVSCDF